MFCFHKRIGEIAFLQVQMGLKSITKKKTNETIKHELLNLLHENDHLEEQGLNEIANYVKSS